MRKYDMFFMTLCLCISVSVILCMSAPSEATDEEEPIRGAASTGNGVGKLYVNKTGTGCDFTSNMRTHRSFRSERAAYSQSSGVLHLR
jgi:hypothetical protein